MLKFDIPCEVAYYAPNTVMGGIYLTYVRPEILCVQLLLHPLMDCVHTLAQ